MTQVSWACGVERVHVLQGGAQHVLVEEGDSVERLVLRAGGDRLALIQSRERRFHVLLAGHRGSHLPESRDLAPQPMDVAGFGGERFVLPAKDFPRPGDSLGDRDIRTSVYSIYEPAVV